MDSSRSKAINFVRCLKCHKIFQCSRYDTAVLLQHIRTDHPEVDIIDTDKTQAKTKTVSTDDAKLKKSCSCIGTNRKSNTSNFKGRSSIQSTNSKFLIEDTDSQIDLSQEEYTNSDYEKEQEEEYEIQPQFARDVDLTQYSITSEILEKYPEIKDCEYCPRNPNANVVYTRRYKINTPTPTTISSIQIPQKRTYLYRTSIEKWRPANGTIYCPKCGCKKRPLIKTQADRFTSNECGACCLLRCWPFCFLPCLIPGHDLEYLHCSNCKNFLGLYDRNKNCIKPNRLYANPDTQKQEKIDSGDEITDVSFNLENISTAPSSPVNSQKTQRLPSIVIDGKELHPDMVARLQKFKKYGALAGIDLDALTDKESANTTNSPNRDNSFKETNTVNDKAPSVGNISKSNAKVSS